MNHDDLLDQYEATVILEDTYGAVRGDCATCLVARALRRVSGKEVSVGWFGSMGALTADIGGCDARERGGVAYTITQGFKIVASFDNGTPADMLIGERIVAKRV